MGKIRQPELQGEKSKPMVLMRRATSELTWVLLGLLAGGCKGTAGMPGGL